MKMNLALICEMGIGVFHPAAFFREKKESALFARMWFVFGLLLAFSMALLVFTAGWNALELRNIARSIQDSLPSPARGSFLSQWDLWIPWNRIFFPVMFLLFVPVMSILRFAALRFLGGDPGSLAQIQTLSILAVLPVILQGAIVGSVHNVMPVHAGMSNAARLVLTIGPGLFSIAAWFWEMVIYVQSVRQYAARSLGQAVFSWILPWAGILGIGLVFLALAFVCLPDGQ